MQINVAQLLKEPTGARRNYHISELAAHDNVDLVNGTVTLIRIDKGILVEGIIKARIKGECNRCLEQTEQSVEFLIAEEFLPSIDMATDTSMNYDPETLTIDNNHILELSNIINQYAILAAPMKFICRDDCAGICPSCGSNLNAGPCGCKLYGDIGNIRS